MMCLLHRLPSGCTSRKAFRKEGRRKYQTTVGSAFTHSHNIRQYMSYKIDGCWCRLIRLSHLLDLWHELITQTDCLNCRPDRLTRFCMASAGNNWNNKESTSHGELRR